MSAIPARVFRAASNEMCLVSRGIDGAFTEGALPSPTWAPGRLVDYAILFKLRLTSLLVMTAWAGYHLGAERGALQTPSWRLLCALVGVGLVTGGATALNQVIEREADGRMLRTQQRPLPCHRMGVAEPIAVGTACILGGAAYLALTTNVLTGLLSVLAVAVYIVGYTPLKKQTPISTFLGALAGAMPPLLGWTAARGRIEWEALVLSAILFLWQFPHFHSIEWLYREDYRRAGMRMLPVVQGRWTGPTVLACSMMLVPVSLLPAYLHLVNGGYLISTLILSLGFLIFPLRLAGALSGLRIEESNRFARQLLRASVLYLVVLCALIVISVK
jgi:heme o synthase